MFRRVITEDWHQILPLAGFALTFAVFLVAILRTLLMRREKCHTLARLPLEENASPAPAPPRPPCTGNCQECRCLRDGLAEKRLPLPK